MQTLEVLPTFDLTPEQAREVVQRVTGQLREVIVGQEEIIRLLLACLFCNGHCLLIGVPGLAKTLLVRSLAEVLHLGFRRIQFTPDLMPADIIGSELLKDRAGTLEFEFHQGPVFTSLLLADEINRTPPKTQSALLEAMQERKVTVAGETRLLPDPFLVVATQNPIEQEGTYPLPEAQLDRFMFSLHLDYPRREEEVEIVRRTTYEAMATIRACVTREEVLAVQRLVRSLPVSDHVVNYAVDLSIATRPGRQEMHPVTRDYIEWGAGPRASQCLVLGAKAVALLRGRTAPETSDVREVALPVMQHRVITNYRATGANLKSTDVLRMLLETVKERTYST
jgi:MoxR-like ATPase